MISTRQKTALLNTRKILVGGTAYCRLVVFLAGALLINGTIVGMKKAVEFSSGTKKEKLEFSDNDKKLLKEFIKEYERKKNETLLEKISKTTCGGQLEIIGGLLWCGLGYAWFQILLLPVSMGLGAPNANKNEAMLILLGPPAAAAATGTYLFQRGVRKMWCGQKKKKQE